MGSVYAEGQEYHLQIKEGDIGRYVIPVSYTHLDVYKRQDVYSILYCITFLIIRRKL